MTRKHILIGLGCAAILCGAETVHWYRGHRPIAYHNDCIRSAIQTAVRIEVSSIPQAPPPPKVVIVTNREDIVGMLNRLKFPWSTSASEVAHSCAGHLRIKIIMPTLPNYELQYDHGIGIYPIDGGRYNPGFCDLPKQSCEYLNAYFTKLGYSRDQLGIHERRTNR
jgi:hypothetical protein